jgi:hypoxanthine-DNA glycosylase
MTGTKAPLKTTMIGSFDPIAGPDARVLILGTAPSVRSLELQQYYGHPQNAFWPIMVALFADRSELDYPSRVEMLVRSRVAVWDVLQSAERPGSLDSSIVDASAVSNDIAGFLAEHPGVLHVFFNGAKAQDLFKRHVASANSLGSALEFHRLPSTSPANAVASFDAKLQAWSEVRNAAQGGYQTHSADGRERWTCLRRMGRS